MTAIMQSEGIIEEQSTQGGVVLTPPLIEIDHIYNMDCLQGMKYIPDGSVDMILCDLPYGTTACKWDVIIPFEPLWAHYKRIIKPRGAIVLTGSQPFTSMLIMSNLKWFRYEWVWEKSLATGYLNANRNPMKSHENIAVFSQNGHAYNPQKITGKAYRATRGAVGGVIRDKTVGGYETVNNGDRYPRSVIKVNSENNPLHPTQKPVALFEYLIKTYTNEGETVLDNCIGSGTTAIACLNTGRHYIGFELDKHYYEIALERIRNNPIRML